MASDEFNVSKLRRFNGGVDFDTDTLKLMLMKTTYVFDPDTATVAALTPGTYEVSCTGYTGGPGGSGRKTLTITAAQDDTNNRATIDAADQTWTAPTGDSVGGAILIKHVSGADDTLNIPLIWIDLPDVTFNGTDYVLQFDSIGIAYQA